MTLKHRVVPLMFFALLLSITTAVSAQTNPYPQLTQTYKSAQGTFSFIYPAGWTVDDKQTTSIILTGTASEKVTVRILIGTRAISKFLGEQGMSCADEKLATTAGVQIAYDNFAGCSGNKQAPQTAQNLTPSGNPSVLAIWYKRPIIYADLGDGVPALILESSQTTPPTNIYSAAIAGTLIIASSNAPSPTATPTEVASNPIDVPASTDVTLTQTYTAPDGNYSFSYPDGWKTLDLPDAEGVMILSPNSNSINVSMIVGPQSILKLLNVSFCPEENLSMDNGVKGVLDHYLDCTSMRQHFGEPQVTDINGKFAAVVHDKSTFTIVIDLGNGIPAFVQGKTNFSDDPTLEPIFLAMAGSIEWHGNGSSSAIAAPTNTDVPSLENTPIPTQEAATNQNNGGLIAYVAWKYGSEDQTDIYVVNSDGSNQRNITNNPGEYSGLAWSLDGNLIAYAGRSGIYVMNADGSNNHKIGDGYGIGITWSPDGTQIAFADVANSAFQLYIMKADGSNVRRITDSLAFITGVSWSPSGSEIAFSSNVDGDMEIYKINIDGSNQQQLTNNTIDDRQPKWSPDGSKILFTSSPEGPSWLYTMNSDGTDVHQVSDTSAVSPTWSPDGSQIAFTKANDGVIYVINSDGTNPHRITIADENSSNIKEDSPAWQPTGASAMASTVAPTPQPQSADSGAQLKLGTVYTSITTDQNGCGTEVNPFLSAHYGFYVVVDASDIPKDTRLFVRLSHNGQPIEDAEEITVDKDYVGVCVYFHFQPVGKDFDPGDYEGQFFINGEAGPSVKFILHATN